MERTKRNLIIAILVLFALNLTGSEKKDIYDAYINNAMSVWKKIIDQLELKTEKNSQQQLELVNYQYGYIACCFSHNHKDEAVVYLKLAEDHIRLLEMNKFELSKTNAYKSAFYGYHIGLNVFSAPFIGSKSAACAKLSVAIDPNDYFGYIQLGNVRLHAPSFMGGSKPEALKNFLKARALMERDGLDRSDDWNYLSLLISIAKTYEILNEANSAKLTYEEILKFEPKFKWVKDELYPQLLKKIK